MALPRAYIAALAVVGLLFAFIALTALGVITVESVFLLLINYVFQVLAVTVLAALGGVLVGMVMAHRMLATRRFTPFERELLETLTQVRAQLAKREALDRELMERLEGLEKRMR